MRIRTSLTAGAVVLLAMAVAWPFLARSAVADPAPVATPTMAAVVLVVGDPAATERLREQMRAERGEPEDFDFGPTMEEILARTKEETGLDPPTRPEQLRWAPLQQVDRVRERVEPPVRPP